MKKSKRFTKPGWIIAYIVIARIIFSSLFGGKVEIEQTIRLEEGDTISKIYDQIGWIDRIKMKRFFRKHEEDVASIQPGAYAFS